MALSQEKIDELLAKRQTRWERLEGWLFDNEVERFTVHELAASVECPVPEATAMVQAYLAAQRREDSDTLYVLKREGRTRNAIWSVGNRTVDARVIGGMLFEDVEVKVRKAFAPDLKRLAQKNPKAAKYCEQKIEAVMNGALVVLKSAVDGYIGE